MSFPAKFPGRCDDCRKPIRPGEDVEFKGLGDDRRLVHVVCEDAGDDLTQLDLDARLPVCPHFMVPPCAECEET